MTDERKVLEIRQARPTTEGAGVHLRRAFGSVDQRLDPFLLLDHFGSENPEDYMKGFPWHPHRGIETITYMLDGEVEHQDSLSNRGVIGPGDVQWMTAGSGIIHQEMPRRSKNLEGFQLWSNLPAKDKMMTPRYRDVPASTIPEATLSPGATAKVIAGTISGTQGPVRDIVTDPLYLDVNVDVDVVVDVDVDEEKNSFLYLFRGSLSIADRQLPPRHLAILSKGDRRSVRSGQGGARFLLAAGKPLGEPVAWGGPIVMNTQEELYRAFEEYENGTFLRHGKK
jgi:redox-sensitive bicupin YhaK (pirin superfamily)